VAGLSGDGAGVFSKMARQQYAALIWVQTRGFLNSFRTMRGSFELGSRILTGFFLFLIAFAPVLGFGFGAYASATEHHPLGIAVMLWVVCLLWQFFSALAPALAGQNPDLAYLLRYPVSLGSWALLYLAYGVIAPSTLIGLIWTAAIGVGITVARPGLFLWTALILALFAFFNILLARTILAWIQRWMAQRRTREIITGLFLFFMLAAQAFNPVFHQRSKELPFGLSQHKVVHLPHRVSVAQAVFPPGVAAEALTQPIEHNGMGLVPLAGLTFYTLVVAALLGVRLRGESRGESFSESPRPTASFSAGQARRRPVLDFSGPAAAVFEKDLRYLMRSGPLLYALAAPLVMVFLFSSMRLGVASPVRATYVLPIGIMWAFVGLSRLANNNLGAEGEGLSFYFLSPTPLRSVILGKNFLHLVLFVVEALLIGGFVVFRFGLPDSATVAATLAWFLFAIPASLASGNLLSILMPFRMSTTRLKNEPGAVSNSLVSLGVQAAILGVGAAVWFPFAVFGREWLATPVLLLLAAAGVFAYLRLLSRIDSMIQSRRDDLTLEIAKAPAP
jgi:ABC-2 type transport system permease protein